jgi:repressor LexA
MMSQNLTQIQRKALDFIHESQKHQNHTPTLRELCDYMGYKAIGSAQDLVAALRKKGFLQAADRQSARSLTLTELAQETLGVVKSVFAEVLDNALIIPCLGSVPAGNPVEAIANHSQSIVISPSILGGRRIASEKLFALSAKGESMQDAGILDGDWLVVESQNDAQLGDIVVARLEDDATVKRLMKDPSRGWYLQPENERFSPIYAEHSPFEIIGKVVGLQRTLS